MSSRISCIIAVFPGDTIAVKGEMTMKQYNYENESMTIGAPFDPFGLEAENRRPTARIIPFQFDYPTYPLGFSLLRDTEPDKTETDAETGKLT